MAASALNKNHIFITISLVLLASLDLFRAYLEITFVNYFFAFKEFLLVCLLFLLCNSSRVKISSSLLIIVILTFFYCCINIVDEDGILLSFIFLKYVVVFFLSYLIFQNLSLEILQKGGQTVLIIFSIYSICACFYAFVFPDSMVRSGRVSGFANPSFLSYIYLLCFLYAFFSKNAYWSIWFVIVGFLTLTKTFFVAFFVVLIYLMLFSSLRKKILVGMIIVTPVLYYVLTLNQEIYITYNRALTVLIDRNSEEYNSMDDRLGRIASFEENNSGNFIFGYGTGRAGSAAVFVENKIGKKINYLTDFENQILNIYYSLGILGVSLLYYPFVYQFIKVCKSKTNFKEKHCFYLFFIIFLLYNLTLNILESFTACIITLLFLIIYGKKNEDSY